MDGAEYVGAQGVLGNVAIGGGVEFQRHLGRDARGREHVGDLLLRAVDAGSQFGLRAEPFNGSTDQALRGGFAGEHTSFLVRSDGKVNQQTCVARHQRSGKFGAMGIAENIKRHRAEAALSQNQLASLAGVSQQLISQLERGENVATTKLPSIAKALGVGVEDIDPAYAVRSDGGDHLDDAFDQMREAWGHLSGPDRKRAAAFAVNLWQTSPKTEHNE